MFAVVMIVDWSVDLEQYHNAKTGSSVGSNHCSSSTHRPPNEYSCRLYTNNISVISLLVLTFTLDIVLVGILETS